MKRLIGIVAAIAAGVSLASAAHGDAPAVGTGGGGEIVYTQLPYAPSHSKTGTRLLGPGQLRAISPDGSGDRPLKPTKLDQGEPAASPDGQQLAYVAYGSGASTSGVWVSDAQGQRARRVVASTAVQSVAWSPDDTTLIYNVISNGVGPQALYTVPANGSAPPKALLRSRHGTLLRDPTFTPDGQHIVFWRQKFKPYSESIWEADADGQHQRVLIPGAERFNCAEQPAFSRDGAQIAFVAVDCQGGSEALVVASADGAEPRVLPVGKPEDLLGRPAWSPDGSTLAIVDGDGTGKAGSKLDAVDAATGAIRVIREIPRGLISRPTWR